MVGAFCTGVFSAIKYCRWSLYTPVFALLRPSGFNYDVFHYKTMSLPSATLTEKILFFVRR